MPNTLNEESWKTLIKRIKKKECTPFLGAGACHGVLPLGSDLALELAKEHKYPLKGADDLARVAQFIAIIKKDYITPKEVIQTRFKNIHPPNFKEPDEPHGLLADLALPLYITTNYDDFMMQAIKDRNRNPRREICRWDKRMNNKPNIFDSNFKPDVANPVVYHLHGHIDDLDSMVLTEDNYLDFLIAISQNPNLLPPPIEAAFTKTTLLFMGYRLTDWDFRVLFRSLFIYLKKSNGRAHISVQLLPIGDTVSDEERNQAQKYFDQYFDKENIRVYWGSCREFTKDLRRRWEAYNNG